MNGTMQGSGTRDNPYLIEDKEDFFSITGGTSSQYKYYKQVADIDFSGETRSMYIVGYLIYDGGHYKILNWKIVSPCLIEYKYYTELYNMEFINCEVNNNSDCSFILAKVDTVIQNCAFHGMVTSGANGSVVDASSSGSRVYYILGCYFEVKVEASAAYTINGYGIVNVVDSIFNCEFISNTAYTHVSKNQRSYLRRNYILNDFSKVIQRDSIRAITEDGSTKDNNLTMYNIVNIDKCGISDVYVADGVNILTDEECKNITHFEDLGWWL